MARAEAAYAPGMRYCVRARRAAQNPFFAVHCLIRLGGDGWKCGGKNAPSPEQCGSNNTRLWTAEFALPDNRESYMPFVWIINGENVITKEGREEKRGVCGKLATWFLFIVGFLFSAFVERLGLRSQACRSIGQWSLATRSRRVLFAALRKFLIPISFAGSWSKTYVTSAIACRAA